MTRPLLLLGLDGLSPELVSRLGGDADLPHLARLADERTSETLVPGEERYSGLAWEQFSTGLDVATGGRTSGISFDPHTYEVTQPDTQLAPFTRGLDARLVAFDVPYFDLQEGGAEGLARWGAHDPGVARHAVPEGLGAEIEARFGPYPAEPWIYGFVWPDVDATVRMGRDLRRAVEVRTDLTTWLLTARLPGWALALTVVAELHSASEALWHGIDEGHPLHGEPSAAAAREGLVAIYAAVEELVARVAEACPHADVLAFTPHGMGRNAADVPSMLLLPELLYRLETGRRAFEAPGAWKPGSGPVPWPPGGDWSETVLAALRSPAAPRRRRRRLRRPPARSGPPLGWMPSACYQGAWPTMRAFALPSFYDGRVRFNLRGREGAGRVRQAEAGALLEELRGVLAETVDLETGARLDVDVLSPHDGTAPDHIAADADLVVRWNTPTTGCAHPRLGEIGPAPWRRTGGHTGGDGRIAAFGRTVCELPRGLRSPATLAPWVLARYA